MRNTTSNQRNRSEESKLSPGFGLGFDMRSVIERSRGMALKRIAEENGGENARQPSRQGS